MSIIMGASLSKKIFIKLYRIPVRPWAFTILHRGNSSSEFFYSNRFFQISSGFDSRCVQFAKKDIKSKGIISLFRCTI